MRQDLRHLRIAFVLPMVLMTCAVALLISAKAEQPKIDLIVPFLNNQVAIHFDTEAHRAYELQFSDTLASNGVPAGSWSNLYTVPSDPNQGHYVIVDSRAHKQRFYRLRVTP